MVQTLVMLKNGTIEYYWPSGDARWCTDALGSRISISSNPDPPCQMCNQQTGLGAVEVEIGHPEMVKKPFTP